MQYPFPSNKHGVTFDLGNDEPQIIFMKKFSFILVTLSATILCSCNGGEKAGAGSDQNKALKPNVEGISADTSGSTSQAGKVDTTQAYSATDTSKVPTKK